MLFSGSLRDLMHPPQGQIAFLDGLRAMAILLVLSAHLSERFEIALGRHKLSGLPIFENGWVGVDLFFILSGFFIGGQLWKEARRTGTIDVKRFILRRGYRIWPLYYFIFIVTFVLMIPTAGALAARQYGWTDLLFLSNYVSHSIVSVGWSLCTEEQFYIVVPLVLFLVAPRIKQLRHYRPLLWGVMLLIPVLRVAYWMAKTGQFGGNDPYVFDVMYNASITHCDGLIMGMLIANLWAAQEAPKSQWSGPWMLLFYSVVIAGALIKLQPKLFNFTALALFFGAVAWLGLQRRIPIFGGKIFYWISRLSFGMYLNHMFFCWPVVHWLARVAKAAPFVMYWPPLYNLFGTGVLALVSGLVAVVTFALVEHPFLQARKALMGH